MRSLSRSLAADLAGEPYLPTEGAAFAWVCMVRSGLEVRAVCFTRARARCMCARRGGQVRMCRECGCGPSDGVTLHLLGEHLELSLEELILFLKQPQLLLARLLPPEISRDLPPQAVCHRTLRPSRPTRSP